MIEGKLVNLRAREPADAERHHRWLADPELRYLTGDRYAQSLPALESMMSEYVAKPLSFDDPRFSIDTKDGEHIGYVRLFGVSPENRSAQLSVQIGARAHWSKGYGADAVRTLLGFAFAEMNLNRVELHVYDDNARAIACYRKCGFVEEGRLRRDYYARGRYHDVILMAVLRDEWTAAGSTGEPGP